MFFFLLFFLLRTATVEPAVQTQQSVTDWVIDWVMKLHQCWSFPIGCFPFKMNQRELFSITSPGGVLERFTDCMARLKQAADALPQPAPGITHTKTVGEACGGVGAGMEIIPPPAHPCTWHTSNVNTGRAGEQKTVLHAPRSMRESTLNNHHCDKTYKWPFFHSNITYRCSH